MVLENEAIIVPKDNPKIAPDKIVSISANGKERAA